MSSIWGATRNISGLDVKGLTPIPGFRPTAAEVGVYKEGSGVYNTGKTIERSGGMSEPRVLTIQDISCVGRCSMAVALPVLAACGVEACPLPTAVLSTHTGGFGMPHIADLTAHMLPMAEHWGRAGLAFDVLFCGYLGSREQMTLVEQIFDIAAAPGCVKIIDPAMADHGKLYSGFDPEFVAEMKRFCARADWFLPNITEACLLTGTEFRTDYDKCYIDALMEKLYGLGCRHILLTGVSFEPESIGVMADSEYISHRRLSGSCHGTGDLFAAVFAGALARGKSGGTAARLAAEFTLSCMEYTFSRCEVPYGIAFEPVLGELIRKIGE